MKSKSEAVFKLAEYTAHLLCSLLYRVELLLTDLTGLYHLVDYVTGILSPHPVHKICKILHQRVSAVLSLHLVIEFIRRYVPPFLPSLAASSD